MSFANFKKTIWSKYIQTELEKKCKLVEDCWTQFEGEAKAGQIRQVYGRKTVDGVQYGRVTANGWISLKDCKQIT